MTNPMTNPTNPSDDQAGEPEPTGAGAVPASASDAESPPAAEAPSTEPGASPEPIVDPAPVVEPADPPTSETMDLSSATAEAPPTEPDTTVSSGTTVPGVTPVVDNAPDQTSADQTTTELGAAPPLDSTADPVGQSAADETIPVSEPPMPQSEPDADSGAGPTTELMPPVAPPPSSPPEHPRYHHVGRHEEAHDRVWPHFLWELLLLLGLGVLAAVYWAQETPGFEADQLKPLFWSATILGLLATGFSFSLRAGAANLAVAPIAVASSVLAAMGARERDWNEWACIGIAVATAALAGLILGLVIVVLQVPAWAASLGAGFAVIAWTVNSVESDPRLIEPVRGGPDLFDWWGVVFAGVAVVSVIGGLLWTIPGFRAACSARPIGDPADRPSASSSFSVLAAMTASSALAAVAGGFLWFNDRPTKDTGPTLLPNELLGPLSTNGLFLLIVTFSSMVLAVVLLGGTSAFGRRGGVFGTVLAVAIVVLLHEVTDVSHATFWYFTAGGIGIGLVATRLLEQVGRQQAPERHNGRIPADT